MTTLCLWNTARFELWGLWKGHGVPTLPCSDPPRTPWSLALGCLLASAPKLPSHSLCSTSGASCSYWNSPFPLTYQRPLHGAFTPPHHCVLSLYLENSDWLSSAATCGGTFCKPTVPLSFAHPLCMLPSIYQLPRPGSSSRLCVPRRYYFQEDLPSTCPVVGCPHMCRMDDGWGVCVFSHKTCTSQQVLVFLLYYMDLLLLPWPHLLCSRSMSDTEF